MHMVSVVFQLHHVLQTVKLDPRQDNPSTSPKKTVVVYHRLFWLLLWVWSVGGRDQHLGGCTCGLCEGFNSWGRGKGLGGEGQGMGKAGWVAPMQ